jgi:hypothetical protein
MTSAATSCPRWAGRQCRKIASSAARLISAVDPESGQLLPAALAFLVLAHRHPDVRVDRVGAADGVTRIGDHADPAAAGWGERRRARTAYGAPLVMSVVAPPSARTSTVATWRS